VVWGKFKPNVFLDEDLLLIPPRAEEQLAADWSTLLGPEADKIEPGVVPRVSDDFLRKWILQVLGGRYFLSTDINQREHFDCVSCNREVWAKGFCPWCQKEDVIVSRSVPVIDPGLVFLPLGLGALKDWTVAQLAMIGVLYGDLDSALPQGINGYPMLTSMGMLHIEDWLRAERVLRREAHRLQNMKLDEE
jgi:hypothetical protein